jgi:hypothetical protein
MYEGGDRTGHATQGVVFELVSTSTVFSVSAPAAEELEPNFELVWSWEEV